ncbi:MAG: Formate dehydrogenase subunit alpha precursor [Betaproteobacteria bacterium ADurb.Bin341]|nr:MAG: Formate dehydrogenase subunit alpha precursor [Betaproteobacteria bacterium ADurb.Bin341]
MNRRNWLKLTAGGGVGLALGQFVNMGEVQAATAKMKLVGTQEFTTACNLCSCGCGMVCSVREGKLINLEGDPDHVINQGALCSKGASLMETNISSQRLTAPRYRAPGSNTWKEISWDEAFERIANKIKMVRDSTWVATEKEGEDTYPVSRTDAIALLGGAQNTNEEAYLFNKMGRLLGTSYVEHQARL